MSSDMFHSEPAKGAILIDATGQDASIECDLESEIGKFHFEIFNRDVSFSPSSEMRLPIKEDKDFKGLVATLTYEGLIQKVMI